MYPEAICKEKVSSYTVQYQNLKIARTALHISPWQTCSIKHHLNFSGKHSATLQLMCKDFIHKHPPLSTVYGQLQIYTAEWTGAM